MGCLGHETVGAFVSIVFLTGITYVFRITCYLLCLSTGLISVFLSSISDVSGVRYHLPCTNSPFT